MVRRWVSEQALIQQNTTYKLSHRGFCATINDGLDNYEKNFEGILFDNDDFIAIRLVIVKVAYLSTTGPKVLLVSSTSEDAEFPTIVIPPFPHVSIEATLKSMLKVHGVEIASIEKELPPHIYHSSDHANRLKAVPTYVCRANSSWPDLFKPYKWSYWA
jgi:hypothetical protein